MLGLGKDVSGMVRISWDEVGAGTFPDKELGKGASFAWEVLVAQGSGCT